MTTNARGQVTTQTDPEGNLTVYVCYPESDPEGDGAFIAQNLSNKQYGRLRMQIVGADPDDVLSLVGTDGDLVDFIPGIITRTNTPGVYQKLTTRYEGSSTGGCSSCAYDQLGNPLAVTTCVSRGAPRLIATAATFSAPRIPRARDPAGGSSAGPAGAPCGPCRPRSR
jgi:hypothetical protein